MGGRGTKGHLLRGERSCRKCKQETRQQILQLPFPENGVRTVRSQRLPLCFAAITPLSLSPFAAALPLAHMQVQVLEAGKSKVKALADSASGEGLPPARTWCRSMVPKGFHYSSGFNHYPPFTEVHRSSTKLGDPATLQRDRYCYTTSLVIAAFRRIKVLSIFHFQEHFGLAT
uniref:uncharacterized protein LOC132692509 isoform X1 n=1 Tax=Panthera onca TaxID=9690 RepID=UPI0029536602|nr:uncharacterized protein LOC132692509 isoform X1 [Panthera onca]